MASKNERPFRTTASYRFERITRNAVVPFLQEHGISVLREDRRKVGLSESQIISGTMTDGSPVRMRVRLCWRRDGRKSRESRFSAFQLQSKNADGDWDKALRHVADRDISEGITHTLAIQAEGRRFVYAALIPTKQIPMIWERQREVSDRLIREGSMGRVHKNHSENGSSPTLWLQDIRTPVAHEVPDVLWNWPGVVNLMSLAATSDSVAVDDTLDDCPAQDTSQFGSDNPERKISQRSYVKRDPKVRDAVRRRANGGCERKGCNIQRDFPGFLDVHHILGADNSDRVWNCVALCPNCHREAHYSPQAGRINAELLRFAKSFEPSKGSGRLG